MFIRTCMVIWIAAMIGQGCSPHVVDGNDSVSDPDRQRDAGWDIYKQVHRGGEISFAKVTEQLGAPDNERGGKWVWHFDDMDFLVLYSDDGKVVDGAYWGSTYGGGTGSYD